MKYHIHSNAESMKYRRLTQLKICGAPGPVSEEMLGDQKKKKFYDNDQSSS